MILVSALTTLAANQIYYEIARRHGRAALEARFATSPKALRTIAWVETAGRASLAGFAVPLRILNRRCRRLWGCWHDPLRFAVVNTIGAFLWAGSFAIAGYFGAGVLTMLVADIRKHQGTVAIAILVICGALILWRTHAQEPRQVWDTVRQPEELADRSLSVLAAP